MQRKVRDLGDVLFIGAARVELDTRRVETPRGVVMLTPKAVEVLLALVAAAPAVVAKERLLEAGWPATGVGDEVLSNAVWQLRSALGTTAQGRSVIETVPRRGYRLAVPALPEGGEPQAPPVLRLRPLENLTGDPGLDWLADGVSRLLADELVALGGVRVVTTFASLGGRAHAGPGAGLEADLEVGGSVHGGGERVLVRVEVTDAASGDRLWTTRREREAVDLLELQQQVALEIVRELGDSTVLPSRPGGYATAPEVGAVECHLRSRALVRGGCYAEVECGVAQLERATARWPDFAPVHAELARGLYTLARWGRGPGRPLVEAARQSVDRALDLDPGLVGAQVVDALVEAATCWRLGPPTARLALLLREAPSDPDVLDALARCTAAAGGLGAAVDLERRALWSDPLSPSLNTTLGFFLRLAERLDEAAAQLERTLEMAPGWPVAEVELARVLLAAGDRAGAVVSLARAEPAWARFLAGVTAGDRAGTQATLRRWLDRHDGYVAPYWLAERCVWAGETELALDCLRLAAEELQVHVMFVDVEPVFHHVRGTAGFGELLAHVTSATNSGAREVDLPG